MDPVAAASLLLAVCISCLLFTNAWKKMFGNLPPGPMPLPLVGNLLQVKNGGIAKYLHSLHEVYGEVFTVYIGLRPLVVICGYKALKEAFIDQGDHFLNRGRHPNLERIYNNSGMFVANDEKWKKLSQFTVMTLKDFGMGKRLTEDLFQEELQQMVKLFRKTNGKLFNPAIGLDSAAANIIFTMVFGERFDIQDEKFQCMLQSLHDSFVTMSTVWGQLYDIYPGVMYYLPGPHNTMFRRFKEFENFLAQQVKIHQETLDVNSARDFIDSFLIRKEQEKKNETSEFDFKNLMGTIMDIIFGGIETVSTTLKHGLLYLVKYPEVKEKIFRELDEEIGQRRRPSYEDRIKMPYTQAVVHEIQRYCDLFPMGFTHSAGVDTSLRGYSIPKVPVSKCQKELTLYLF